MAEPYNVDSRRKSSKDPKDQIENNMHKDPQESNKDTPCKLELPPSKTGDNFFGDEVSRSSTHTEEGATKYDFRPSFHSDEQRSAQGKWRLKENDPNNSRKVPGRSGTSTYRTRQWVNHGSSFGNLQDSEWNTYSESVGYQSITLNNPSGKFPRRRGTNFTRRQYNYGMGSKSGQLQDGKWNINSEFVDYGSQPWTFNSSANRGELPYRRGTCNAEDGRLRYDKLKMSEIYFELFTKYKLTLSEVRDLTLSEPLKLLLKDGNMCNSCANKIHGVESVDRKIMDGTQFEQTDLGHTLLKQANKNTHVQSSSSTSSLYNLPNNELPLYYKDLEGQIQGPFSGSIMLGWFRAGLIPNNLHVYYSSDPKSPFTVLCDIIPQLKATSRTPPGFSDYELNDVWEATNKEIFYPGPALLRKASENTHFQPWLSTSSLYNLPNDKLPLYYKDPEGQIQGPFSGNNMLGWLEDGYFHNDLHVYFSSDPDSPLMLLGDIIPYLKANSRTLPGSSGNELIDFWDATNKHIFDPGLQKWSTSDAFTTLINQSPGSQIHFKESNIMPCVLKQASTSAPVTHHNILPDSYSQEFSFISQKAEGTLQNLCNTNIISSTQRGDCTSSTEICDFTTLIADQVHDLKLGDITDPEYVENQVAENALKDELDMKTNSEVKLIFDTEDSDNQGAEIASKNELNKKTNPELKQVSDAEKSDINDFSKTSKPVPKFKTKPLLEIQEEKKKAGKIETTSERIGKQSEPSLPCKQEPNTGDQAENTYSAAHHFDVGNANIPISAKHSDSPSGSAWGAWSTNRPTSISFRDILKEQENAKKLNSKKKHGFF